MFWRLSSLLMVLHTLIAPVYGQNQKPDPRLTDAVVIPVLLPALIKANPVDVLSSPDGETFATLHVNGEVRLWSYREVFPLKSWTLRTTEKSPARWLQWSPDGKMLMAASTSVVMGWDRTFESLDFDFQLPGEKPEGVLFREQDQRVVLTSRNNLLRFYDLKTRKLAQPPLRFASVLKSLTVAPDHSSFLLGTGKEFGSWDAAGYDGATAKPIVPESKWPTTRYPLCFSPDAQWCAIITTPTSQTAEQVQVIECRTGQVLQQLMEPRSHASCIDFSSDGQYLAVGCYGIGALQGSNGEKYAGLVSVWDLKTKQVTWRVAVKERLSYISLSKDGKRLMTMGQYRPPGSFALDGSTLQDGVQMQIWERPLTPEP
jgi:WD40 repeat protein